MFHHSQWSFAALKTGPILCKLINPTELHSTNKINCFLLHEHRCEVCRRMFRHNSLWDPNHKQGNEFKADHRCTRVDLHNVRANSFMWLGWKCLPKLQCGQLFLLLQLLNLQKAHFSQNSKFVDTIKLVYIFNYIDLLPWPKKTAT